MYACICHAVTDAEVHAEIADGARTVRDVRKATGAGSGCGSCVKRLSCLLAAAPKQTATATPDPAVGPALEPVLETPVAQPAPVAETPAAEPRWKPRMPISRRPQHQSGCPAAVLALG